MTSPAASRWPPQRIAKWLIAVLLIAGVGFGTLRALKNRAAQQQAVAAAPKAQTEVELAASDLLRVGMKTLEQGVPISGSLKAANFAVVKARVAGELQGLLVREGDSVQAGQVLARIETTEYDARVNQAKRQADAAKAQIDIAQRQVDNNQALVAQGFISKTALDTSLANLDAAQASFKAAQAATDVARKALDDTVLRAPLTGTVSQRLAQPGERLAIDTRILEIMDLGSLELEANVGAADAYGLRAGQTATLSVEGMPAGQGVQAKVLRINPSTQAGSRSVLVYLGVQPAPGLRQGLFAEGRLGTGRAAGLAVALSAVRTDKPAPYVQLLVDQRVLHRNVTLGARGQSAGQTELQVAVDGLKDGDQVLAGSVGALREGTAVRVTAPR